MNRIAEASIGGGYHMKKLDLYKKSAIRSKRGRDFSA